MQTARAITATRPPGHLAGHADASDKACIAAIAKGDRRAMNKLYARHSARVYRFILRLTRSETVAEELISEVFLDVWRHAERFEQRSQVSTWLLAIARNKAISAMRRRHDQELDEDALARVEDPSDDPEETLAKTQRSALLRRCLAQLSPAHREVIDLVYYHEKSVEEAAAVTGIPTATVKTRMYYARQQLAALVERAESGRLVS
jgi:RNA polymerase sigma-70 factor (ECF subfamily)